RRYVEPRSHRVVPLGRAADTGPRRNPGEARVRDPIETAAGRHRDSAEEPDQLLDLAPVHLAPGVLVRGRRDADDFRLEIARHLENARVQSRWFDPPAPPLAAR